jgi:hypothetical protein
MSYDFFAASIVFTPLEILLRRKEISAVELEFGEIYFSTFQFLQKHAKGCVRNFRQKRNVKFSQSKNFQLEQFFDQTTFCL